MSEGERRELMEALVDTIGSARTDTLFAYLPPTGWGEVATKRDLEIVTLQVDARFEALEARFDAKFAAIDAGFDVLEARTDSRFDSVNSRFASVNSRFDAIEARIRALQWMVGLLVVLVAAVLGTNLAR
ncbi:MAG: hypothetical protein ACRDPB_09445 [Nocardioidaceae bacterium]